MDGYLWGAASALWLGILTSISPCPLATNVVAISYVGKRVGSTRLMLASGLLYVAGRMLTYSSWGSSWLPACCRSRSCLASCKSTSISYLDRS
jgi:cytochrome c biogenesis protein CcdA